MRLHGNKMCSVLAFVAIGLTTGSPERLAVAADPASGPPRPPIRSDDHSAGLPGGTTLGELESTALANNPTVVQAAMRVKAAEAKCVQVGLYPNPVLGYKGEDMGDQGSAGKQGAFFGQEFVTSRKLQLDRAVAAQEVQQARHVHESQRQRVLNDVRLTFYEVLVAQRTVALYEQLVHIGEEGQKVAESLQRAKEVAQADVLRARIEAESARIQLQTARDQHQAACRQLAAVIGVPSADFSSLQGDLEGQMPQLVWEDALGRLLTQSPELAEARSGVQRARCALQRQFAERVPNVAVQADVRHDNATRDNIASIAVGIPLPLFNRNQGNIAKADAELITAWKEVNRIELRLQDRLAVTFQRYATARHRVEKYAVDLLPAAKQSLELADSGYRQGEFDYLALLDAQRTYFRVNLTFLESLRELRASSVSIEGLLLTGGLD